MPLKKVYLYDAVNDPLQVPGISIELFDPVNSKRLDSKTSRDFNPQPNGQPSDTWGVELNFPSGKTPVDIGVSDATYKYPGNSLQYLNGDLSDEVYMDLLQLPSGPGGGGPSGASAPPSLDAGLDPPPENIDASPQGINVWINSNDGWSKAQKQAVRGLIFNYARLVGPIEGDPRRHPAFAGLVENWLAAADRIGVPSEFLATAVKEVQAEAQASASAW